MVGIYDLLGRINISVSAWNPDSEVRYDITTEVEKSKKMTSVNFMECDLNQLFCIFVYN